MAKQIFPLMRCSRGRCLRMVDFGNSMRAFLVFLLADARRDGFFKVEVLSERRIGDFEEGSLLPVDWSADGGAADSFAGCFASANCVCAF